MTVYTVSIEFDYEGEALLLATGDKSQAILCFLEEVSELTWRTNHIIYREWPAGSDEPGFEVQGDLDDGIRTWDKDAGCWVEAVVTTS